jgi:hypothetical protein
LKSGHKTLSNNIPVFFQINEMPIPIDVRRIDDDDGIENTLINHHAKYDEATLTNRSLASPLEK